MITFKIFKSWHSWAHKIVVAEEPGFARDNFKIKTGIVVIVAYNCKFWEISCRDFSPGKSPFGALTHCPVQSDTKQGSKTITWAQIQFFYPITPKNNISTLAAPWPGSQGRDPPQGPAGSKMKFYILNQTRGTTFVSQNFSPCLLLSPIVRVGTQPEAQLGQN